MHLHAAFSSNCMSHDTLARRAMHCSFKRACVDVAHSCRAPLLFHFDTILCSSNHMPKTHPACVSAVAARCPLLRRRIISLAAFITHLHACLAHGLRRRRPRFHALRLRRRRLSLYTHYTNACNRFPKSASTHVLSQFIAFVHLEAQRLRIRSPASCRCSSF